MVELVLKALNGNGSVEKVKKCTMCFLRIASVICGSFKLVTGAVSKLVMSWATISLLVPFVVLLAFPY